MSWSNKNTAEIFGYQCQTNQCKHIKPPKPPYIKITVTLGCFAAGGPEDLIKDWNHERFLPRSYDLAIERSLKDNIQINTDIVVGNKLSVLLCQSQQTWKILKPCGLTGEKHNLKNLPELGHSANKPYWTTHASKRTQGKLNKKINQYYSTSFAQNILLFWDVPLLFTTCSSVLTFSHLDVFTTIPASQLTFFHIYPCYFEFSVQFETTIPSRKWTHFKHVCII